MSHVDTQTSPSRFEPGHTTRRPSDEGELVSYRTLRRVVGMLGVTLPIVLAIWGFALNGSMQLQPSISDYYALRTRDALVGVLFTIAWFLFTYRGYDRRDDVAGDFACVFALGVALFPNSGTGGEQIIHFTAATGLFLVLAYFSYFLFTQTSGHVTPEKRIRNRIYRGCGVAIVICIALIGAYHALSASSPVSRLSPVFWLETFALWAFGVSWFVKGETVFKDKPAR